MNNLYDKYKNFYKKTTQKDNKNHLNRWVVSDADFVTVLLAIFMVLWIGSNFEISDKVLAQAKKQEQTQEQKQSPNGPNHLIDGVKNPSDCKEIKVIEFEKTLNELNIALKDKREIHVAGAGNKEHCAGNPGQSTAQTASHVA